MKKLLFGLLFFMGQANSFYECVESFQVGTLFSLPGFGWQERIERDLSQEEFKNLQSHLFEGKDSFSFSGRTLRVVDRDTPLELPPFSSFDIERVVLLSTPPGEDPLPPVFRVILARYKWEEPPVYFWVELEVQQERRIEADSWSPPHLPQARLESYEELNAHVLGSLQGHIGGSQRDFLLKERRWVVLGGRNIPVGIQFFTLSEGESFKIRSPFPEGQGPFWAFFSYTGGGRTSYFELEIKETPFR